MHNTGNPLGSTQVLDLYDNSEAIDHYVNSQEDSFPDRFGTKRLTLAGLIKRSMALRNEINDFSGAMTFKPEWTDVPMNVSEGVGGEGGALNLQAEALGNRLQEIIKNGCKRLEYHYSPEYTRTLHEKLTDFISVADFEPIGDGITDDTIALQKAIDATPEFGTLLFKGKYLFDTLVVSKPIKLIGDAELTFRSIRVKTSNFTSELSGKLIAREYSSSVRAFQIIAYEDGVNYENIKILFNNFYGFFYSTDLRGRGYRADPSDPSNRVLKNVLILGCTSIAPDDGKNRGHFQHTGVTNVRVICCATYGGKNATSYNFINGNGFIVVIGCYDDNNSYGSLEIENNKISSGTVSGNVFGHDLWIDDTSNITITGNNVLKTLRITAQSNDVSGINISSNTVRNLSLTKFGENPIGKIYGTMLIANSVIGGEGITHGVFCDSSVKSVTIDNNIFSDLLTNSIALVRSEDGDKWVIKNNMGKRPLIVSSTGGTLVSYGNEGFVSNISDNRAKHVDTMVNGSTKDYLDVPGKYLHGTKYLGEIIPNGTVNLTLPFPHFPDLSFRSFSLLVLIRDPVSNNTSTFRIDGIHKLVGGTIGVSFGTNYSIVGQDAGNITITNSSSNDSELILAVTNTNLTKSFQVTIISEITSRFGVSE